MRGLVQTQQCRMTNLQRCWNSSRLRTHLNAGSNAVLLFDAVWLALITDVMPASTLRHASGVDVLVGMEIRQRVILFRRQSCIVSDGFGAGDAMALACMGLQMDSFTCVTDPAVETRLGMIHAL